MVPISETRDGCHHLGRIQRQAALSLSSKSVYDFFGELTKLQQTELVQDYQTQFEKLLGKVGLLPQPRQVSCFVSGLQDSIRTDVQVGKPITLLATIRLARLYGA